MMIRHRLERLLTVMNAVIADNKPFRMSAWMASLSDFEDWQQRQADEPNLECGTACCAAGYGALDPILQDEGLHMVMLDEDDEEIAKIFSVDDFKAAAKFNEHYTRMSICYDGEFDFEATAAFFGIDQEAAEYLFNDGSYPTGVIRPNQVVERIKEVLTSESKPRWHFACRSCGYDDKEAGRLATDEERTCPLCASDSGHVVSLEKWLAQWSDR